LRRQDTSASNRRREYSAAIVIGVVSFLAVWIGRALDLSPGPSFIATIMWSLLATLFLRRPGPYAVAVALILASSAFLPSVYGDIVERRRSFFGVHRVALDGDLIKLVHGSTVHGIQSATDPADPRAYYHRKSPIANLIDALNLDGRLKSVGVVGLGSGALAAYSAPGQRWTFFEIDPDVKSLAETRFRYLANAKGDVDIVIGDARRSLSRPGETFDLLVIDAFGSDAIPAHLLTREAMEAYRKRLNPGGVIAMHVSNRYLDLFPVLAELGWQVRQCGPTDIVVGGAGGGRSGTRPCLPAAALAAPRTVRENSLDGRLHQSAPRRSLARVVRARLSAGRRRFLRRRGASSAGSSFAAARLSRNRPTL
jgi:SAM-dependent methyltransferase